MRLFEVDMGSARDVLAVLQGLANKDQQQSNLPFPVVQNIFRSFGYALGDGDRDSVEILKKLKNEVDPEGNVISDITDNAEIVLNTNTPSDRAGGQIKRATGPSVDQMAAANTDLSPKI